MINLFLRLRQSKRMFIPELRLTSLINILPDSVVLPATINQLGFPYLRLLGSAEWVPTAEQTPLSLVEGVVPTLRNVQWKNPGLAGVNLLATDRVMVLV